MRAAPFASLRDPPMIFARSVFLLNLPPLSLSLSLALSLSLSKLIIGSMIAPRISSRNIVRAVAACCIHFL